ncbi:MAG TPA: CPBP family intramembrane glutamic endopeptidase [Longimicrobiaceae bacterium]
MTTTPAHTTESAELSAGSYWRASLALFAPGLVGILSLLPMMRTTAESIRAMPGGPDLPTPALQAVLLINPLVLLLAGVGVGTALAPRVGLRSHLAELVRGVRRRGRPIPTELARAMAAGALTGIALVVLDALSLPMMGGGVDDPSVLDVSRPRSLSMTLTGILYGGITEELISRWGLMSLVVWILWRVAQRGQDRPRPWIAWSGIVVAAVLFGAGHLGAVAAEVALTPLIVARTVALNSIGGVVFGWLFWRYSLESAMVAHAMVHVAFTLASWVLFLMSY